jgi:bacterioferritin
MWQHVLATGIQGVAVKDIFKEIAITEMKHAESLAEKLAQLGGTPTIKPDPIFVGNSLKEMIENNVKAEEEALDLYKQTIKVADQEGEITTRRLVANILSEEEDHLDTFTNLLEE